MNNSKEKYHGIQDAESAVELGEFSSPQKNGRNSSVKMMGN